MADQVNDGAYRISGRFGEGFFIDPSGRRPPMKIIEATQITFSLELGVEEVPLAGNDTGEKDGPETKSGQMNVQQIDAFFENLVLEARSGNVAARRAARDAGQRIDRTFTLQVWQDDPEALGALGYELTGVRLSRFEAGFDFGQVVTAREHPFRFRNVRRIKSFERIANSIDPATGLPAIRYLTPDNA